MARAAAKKSSPKKATPKKVVKAKVAKASPAKPVAKKEKKVKDPNAPKRAMSAYFLWLKDNRASLTKAGMSVTDVSKAAGVEWNKLKDKTKYEKAAAEDKKRYEKEMAAYKSGGTVKKAAKSKK